MRYSGTPHRLHGLAGLPRRAGIAVLLPLLMPLLGCQDPDPATPGLTRGQFIDVVVAIRNAELDVEREDSADVRFQAKRDSILAAHEITEEELYDFLEDHPELDYMDAVWDSVTQRLKRPIREVPDTPMVKEPRPGPRGDDRGAGLGSVR